MVSFVAFSAPDTIIGATLGTTVLVAAIFLLARAPGAPRGISLMGLAFTANILRYLVLLLLPEHTDVQFVLMESFHGLCNVLLLAGSAKLAGRFRAWPFVLLGGVVLADLSLAAVVASSFLWRYGPLYLFGGLATMLSGGLFLDTARRKPRLGFGPVGVILLAWGLYKLVFLPFHDAAWLGQIRFVLSDGLATALAVAVIVLAVRSQAAFNRKATADLDASRRLAEASARQLAVVLENLSDGVLTAEEDGRISTINSAAEVIFGVTGRSVIGRPVSVLLPDPQDPGNRSGLPGTVADRGEKIRDCYLQRPGGLPQVLEMSVSSIVADGRRMTVAILRDVTAARQETSIDALVHDVNQRVLQGGEVTSLAPFLCHRLIFLFGLRHAWIGRRAADGTIPVLGYAGPEDLGMVLTRTPERWDADTPGLAAQALALGETCRQMADGRPACPGRAAIPLRVGHEVKAVICIHGLDRISDADIAHFEDLAERLSVPLQMMVDQRRLRLQGAAMAVAANAIFITDRHGTIEWVNDAFVRLSGYRPEEALGRSPRILHSGAHTEAVYKNLWQTILAGEVWRGELIERGKDGNLYTVEQTVTPMLDRQGQVSHFVVVQENITDRKQAEEKIRFLSNYDAMTSLPNRRLFRERLGQALTRADALHHPVAVLFLDLDRFSRINDTMGHDLGDRLLASIVERLGQVTRSADMLARVGGDEFAVILDEGVDVEGVVLLARRMLDGVTTPFDLDGHQVHVGASIGIAVYPEDGADADQLIKNADMAMYRAIHEVPNGYRFFSNAMNEDMQQRNATERDLRQALARDEFVLHYQPQRDVLTGNVIGLEALVRWQHPERGLVFPDQFISLCEETGLIIPLGQLVCRMACRQIADWLAAGVTVVPVAVNVSAVQLHRPDFVADICRIVEDTLIQPQWLELELTESGLMVDAQAAEQMLRALNGFGVKLAIDDFGTGYSSLNYLKRFPVSKLKIDRGFVRYLSDESSDDAAISRAIITLGHSLGLQVVSEGVETEEQLSYLRRQGCDAVQGYLISRPVPASQVPAMLGDNAPTSRRMTVGG
jgi:diguanylate cyclase (GGDEF)-like protein/PAS domain S-box-containing protein